MLRNVLVMLLLLPCSTSFAGLFGPSNSDECIFDGLDDAKFSNGFTSSTRSEIAALKRDCENKYEYERTDLFDPLLESCGFEGWAGQRWFPEKHAWVLINNLNEYVAKYNFGTVEGIGGDVNYKLGATMPFSGDLSEYQWNIVNIAASMGDMNLYLLGKQKGWCN